MRGCSVDSRCALRCRAATMLMRLVSQRRRRTTSGSHGWYATRDCILSRPRPSWLFESTPPPLALLKHRARLFVCLSAFQFEEAKLDGRYILLDDDDMSPVGTSKKPKASVTGAANHGVACCLLCIGVLCMSLLGVACVRDSLLYVSSLLRTPVSGDS